MTLRLPQTVQEVLARLVRAGYEAYLVGGAVRDLLLSRPPHDFDLATSATPDEVKAVFSDCRTVDTGLAHGTVTVLFAGEPMEITTFRADGSYTDGRHPDGVRFGVTLEEDLARRDFTVGAMALGADGVLIDPFGGRADLEAGVLRCVGEPERRFCEDALRILRAVRLVSQHGFVMEASCERAVRALCHTLCRVSRERLFSELCLTLVGAHVTEAMLGFREVFAVLVPEHAECFDFDQHTVYHCYDVYTHVAHTVGAVREELPLRLAAFYHDVGKPRAFFFGTDGRGHFTGHPAHSRAIAEASLAAFAAPRRLAARVCHLVEHHDEILVPTRRTVRRALVRHGAEELFALLELERADALTHARWTAENKTEQLRQFSLLLEEELAAGACTSPSDLALTGRDLMEELSLPEGERLGALLHALLEDVVEERVENTRAALLAAAREKSRAHGD